MVNVYLAIVRERIEEEDAVYVMLYGGSVIEYKVKVLRTRSTPLYGLTGNLPDIGEQGIVLHLDGYGAEWFWLGSYTDFVNNICNTENGKILFHHESDVWMKLSNLGDCEFSHPSGTYIKIGSDIDLSARTRFVQKDDTQNLKESKTYDIRSADATHFYLQHTWRNGAMSYETCFYDIRKQDAIGNIYTTTIHLDDIGNVTITHNTLNGALSVTLDKNGNLIIVVPKAALCNANGSFTVDSPIIQLGGNTGLKKLVTDAFVSVFNSHTHGGGSVPTQQIDSSHLTSVVKGK